MATIEVTKDKKGEFRFRVKSRNGEITVASESYKSKAKAMATIKSLQSGLATAKVIDLTAPPSAAKPSANKSAKKTTKKVAKPAAKVMKVKPAATKKKPAKPKQAATPVPMPAIAAAPAASDVVTA